MVSREDMRISRKEGQRFTACRSTVSHQVGPVLVRQDVVQRLDAEQTGKLLEALTMEEPSYGALPRVSMTVLVLVLANGRSA
jgi:hypothetical protein